jgi:malonyl CoA-acyl carrier protein transacylase
MNYSTLVVAPGRGSYQKQELGYISQNLSDTAAGAELLAGFDQSRVKLGLSTVSSLDQAPQFNFRRYQQADNAAALILASGFIDYQALQQSCYQPTVITGNSMGWYTALACSGVWQSAEAMRIASLMAQYTSQSHGKDDNGGQLIYPLVDQHWRPKLEYQQQVNALLADFTGQLYMSILYGGYAVLAGSSEAISIAMQTLPKIDERFPLLLPGHSAFHSPFMAQASEQALQNIGQSSFQAPAVPLVDGCGRIWQPDCSDLNKLRDYTLRQQVTETYNFTASIQVAVKEFCPQRIVLLGPGNGLAGAVIQALIELNWHGLSSKQDFIAQQQQQPWLLAMGTPAQRAILLDRPPSIVAKRA